MGPEETYAPDVVVFDFVWHSDDPLGGKVAPLRYGRVEVDFGGDHLAEGVIAHVGEFRDGASGKLLPGIYVLRITVPPPDAELVKAALDRDENALAVRVHS